jgi:hypothetical protein
MSLSNTEPELAFQIAFLIYAAPCEIGKAKSDIQCV